MVESKNAKKSFLESEFKSIKHSNYFDVYDEILSSYKGKKIKVLEIGVLNGGGLLMLRKILGDNAQIVGVDLNPSCLKFNDYGFKILIGDQSDDQFWVDFFSTMGKFDVIIDDGGHTNSQQINSLNSCIENIADDGIYVTEDVHTSYWIEFGNPSKSSYINYVKKIIDVVNSRGPRVKPQMHNSFYSTVHSISIYQSIVCFRINRLKSLASNHISNSGKNFAHQDFRDNSSAIYPILSLLNLSNRKLNIYAKVMLLVLYHKTLNVKLQLQFRKVFKSSNKSRS
jgi:hypothetical protein